MVQRVCSALGNRDFRLLQAVSLVSIESSSGEFDSHIELYIHSMLVLYFCGRFLKICISCDRILATVLPSMLFSRKAFSCFLLSPKKYISFHFFHFVAFHAHSILSSHFWASYIPTVLSTSSLESLFVYCPPPACCYVTSRILFACICLPFS
jgi:hypothetical protein